MYMSVLGSCAKERNALGFKGVSYVQLTFLTPSLLVPVSKSVCCASVFVCWQPFKSLPETVVFRRDKLKIKLTLTVVILSNEWQHEL